MICSVLTVALQVKRGEAPLTEVEDYVIEFYDDFLVNEESYYNKYYTFLMTHTFDVNPSYSKDINEIFIGGEDVSAALQDNPGLATNLYYMVTEFPWYSQFSATATAPNPTILPYEANEAETSATAQTVKSTSSLDNFGSPLSTAISSIASSNGPSIATTVSKLIVSTSTSMVASPTSESYCADYFSLKSTDVCMSTLLTTASSFVATTTSNEGIRTISVNIWFAALLGGCFGVLIL